MKCDNFAKNDYYLSFVCKMCNTVHTVAVQCTQVAYVRK